MSEDIVRMNEDINHYSTCEPIGYTSTGPDQSDKEMFDQIIIEKLKDRLSKFEKACIDAIAWIEDDRFDQPCIQEEWYHDMRILIGDSKKE